MAEEKLHIEDEATPLQNKLDTIATEIGKIGVYVAILTFIGMTLRYIITCLMKGTPLLTDDTLSELVNYLILSITIIVVAVPEGLPLAVTISLAFSVMKMKEENNLVRKLEASETMGGANEICTDKTGTLTINQMTVKKLYVGQRVIDGDESSKDKIPFMEDLSQCVLFNCSARIEQGNKALGNCTEVGLINYLMLAGVKANEVIEEKEGNILQMIPFNSKRKRATTVVDIPSHPN